MPKNITDKEFSDHQKWKLVSEEWKVEQTYRSND